MCVKDAHVKRSHSNAETLKFHQHQGIIKLGSKTDAAGFAKGQKNLTLNSTAHEQGVKDKTER